MHRFNFIFLLYRQFINVFFLELFLHLIFRITGIKGAVSRDFLTLFFFHESNPSEPLINRLKWFFLKIRFREDIRKIRLRKAKTARSRFFFKLLALSEVNKKCGLWFV